MKSFKNNLGWYFYKSHSGLGIRRKDPSKKSLRNSIFKASLLWIIIATITFFGIMAEKGCPPEIAFSIIAVFTIIVVIFSLLEKFWLLKIITIKRRNSSMIINGMNIPCYLFKA